jgi:hypothetical protein
MRAPRIAVRALSAATIAVAAVLLAAPFALAKEGGLVTLAAPIPRDAEPGSSLTVTFSVTVPDENGHMVPFSGSPMVLKLVGPDGTTTEAMGAERGTPGTYTALIEVPASGISSAIFGIRGTSTTSDGTTSIDDLAFDVDGLLFTTTTHLAAAPAAPDAAPAPPPADYRLAILGLVAIVVTAIGLATLVIAGRRGSLRSTQPGA